MTTWPPVTHQDVQDTVTTHNTNWTNLAQTVSDIIGAAIVAGTNASVSYDPTSGTVTVGFTSLGTEDLPANSAIGVAQNSDGTWPNRPSPRTDLFCIWRRMVAGSGNPPQATAPDTGGAYPTDAVVGA